jgi:hypothetical protein
MTGTKPRSGSWLLRSIGLVAALGCVFVIFRMAAAMRAGSWLAVPELAALELTVVAALGVAAMPIVARGRRVLCLEAWVRAPGWRGQWERLALIWCASLAAVLGVSPGFALGLGPTAVWPPGLIALGSITASTVGSERLWRVAWLLCTSYGLAATASLVVVGPVF